MLPVDALSMSSLPPPRLGSAPHLSSWMGHDARMPEDAYTGPGLLWPPCSLCPPPVLGLCSLFRPPFHCAGAHCPLGCWPPLPSYFLCNRPLCFASLSSFVVSRVVSGLAFLDGQDDLDGHDVYVWPVRRYASLQGAASLSTSFPLPPLAVFLFFRIVAERVARLCAPTRFARRPAVPSLALAQCVCVCVCVLPLAYTDSTRSFRQAALRPVL